MASNDQAGHRRINEVLIAYWRSLRRDRRFPDETDIDIESLKDIWDSCFLVRKDTDPLKRYSYLYLGSSLVEAYGDNASEREICEMLVFPSSLPLIGRFDEVMEKGEPVLDQSDFTNARGVRIRYRSLLLPLGDEKGEAAYILGGMRWKSH